MELEIEANASDFLNQECAFAPRTSSLLAARPLSPSADIGPGGQSPAEPFGRLNKVQSVVLAFANCGTCRRTRPGQLCAKRSRHPNQANGVRNVSFMRQAPKNETAAAAMIR